jgi:ABC-type multidrug transport system ATPase subunit
LLLDEPTAGLDGQGFEVLALLLEEARGRGATVIFSSHLLSDLMDHCDQVFVLLSGHFVAQGPPQGLFSREDAWRIEATQMSDQQARATGSWIEQNGGHVERIVPSGKTLFDLYREHS